MFGRYAAIANLLVVLLMLVRSAILRLARHHKRRRWPIVLGPEPVPAGQQITLSSTIARKEPFHARQLLATSDAEDLFVEHFSVDAVEQLPTDTNHISVKTFLPGLTNNELPFGVGKHLCIQIKNHGTQDRVFSMTIFGYLGNSLFHRLAEFLE